MMGLFSRKKKFTIRDIEFHTSEQELHSIGLTSYVGKEIKVDTNDLTIEQLSPILTYLVEFIQDNKLNIKNGDRLSCFTWSLSFLENGDYFHILEASPEKEGYIKGLSITYDGLSQQINLSEKLNVEPNFPLFDQIILIDPLIRSGLTANLFRWKKDDPDSGWVAMTNEFTGNSFEQITIGQFISYFPLYTQFIALPPGFKVIWDGNDAKIGFEENMTIKSE